MLTEAYHLQEITKLLNSRYINEGKTPREIFTKEFHQWRLHSSYCGGPCPVGVQGLVVVVRAVLRSEVVGSGVAIAVWRVLLLLGIHWQDVLHMLRLFALLFTLHALRCAQEQAEGQQGHASANPRNHVRPVILDGRGFLQDLIPRCLPWLGLQLLLLVVLDSVPQSHATSGEQTGQEHEDGGEGDVPGRPPPAADDARPEGHEHEEERHDEQGDHRASHVESNHLILRELWGVALLVEDVVVDVLAVGLDGGQVELLSFGLALGVAHAEQALGAGPVEAAVLELWGRDVRPRQGLLNVNAVHFDILPIISAESDGQQRHRHNGAYRGQR